MTRAASEFAAVKHGHDCPKSGQVGASENGARGGTVPAVVIAISRRKTNEPSACDVRVAAGVFGLVFLFGEDGTRFYLNRNGREFQPGYNQPPLPPNSWQ